MPAQENLQELQVRLAERLARAHEAGAAATWLAVRLGDLRALLPLVHAGEIFTPVAISPLPYVVPWFAGVTNLRGSLYGVADLACFLQQVPRRMLTQSAAGEARLLTLHADLAVNCALWLDALAGLRHPDAFVNRQVAPANAPAYWGERFTDADGVVWQEIDLRQLSQHESFLAIGA